MMIVNPASRVRLYRPSRSTMPAWAWGTILIVLKTTMMARTTSTPAMMRLSTIPSPSARGRLLRV